jgi:TRAP-type C4-dicarboxylate transport system permease large subunit
VALSCAPSAPAPPSFATAGPFSWLLTSLGAIKDLEVWLLSYADSPLLFALVMVTFIYVLGMVMDAAANIIVVGECPADC